MAVLRPERLVFHSADPAPSGGSLLSVSWMECLNDQGTTRHPCAAHDAVRSQQGILCREARLYTRMGASLRTKDAGVLLHFSGRDATLPVRTSRRLSGGRTRAFLD